VSLPNSLKPSPALKKTASAEVQLRYLGSFVRAVDDSGAGVCWIRVSADGTRMYTSNTGDNSISVYDTTDPLKPVQIQRQVLKGADSSSFQLELDPSGRTLFAISQRAAATTPLGEGSNLHVLNVRPDGRVFETEHSPLALPVPSTTRPQGLATL
jgi:DNA-binding beta-propeller fold protein YncE